MKAHKGWETNREAQRNAVADMVMYSAALQCRELKPYKAFSTPEKKADFKADFDFLVGEGCDPKALVTALQMANTIRVPDAPSSKQVKSLLNQILRVSHELATLEESFAAASWNGLTAEEKVPSLCELLYQHASCYERSLRTGKTGLSLRMQKRVRALVNRMLRLTHDIPLVERGSLMFFVIQNWRRAAEDEPKGKPLQQHLRDLAEDFEDWLRMASEGGLPRSHSLMRVNRVCPVLYVKWATRGRPFHERVANLLSIVSSQINAPQLAKEVGDFEEQYPYASDYIRMSLSLVHLRKKRYRVLSVKPYQNKFPGKRKPPRPKKEQDDFLIVLDSNGEILFSRRLFNL